MYFIKRRYWLVLVFLSACSSQPDSQHIINKAIEKHGGEAFENSRIVFTFRDIRYTAERQDNRFEYTRSMNDSSGVIVDRLTNTGLLRTINDSVVQLSSEDSLAYANSVNSVIYFAKLPYKLNDAAVNKKLLGENTIKGEPYYEIAVTFDQQGGGNDHEDSYIYWIHRDNFTMDYLAYRFHIDEGGTRFREAKNVRTINGIRFTDYNNFGSSEMQHPLEEYDTYFKADTLNKVSEINLENIAVELLNEDY